jgi:predicted AAA+ superfamily ATPase
MRSGELIQFASLGTAAGISANTAKRYMHYLELSYQIILLAPWFRNTEKRLSKSPKLHFLDNGVRRGILRRTGDPNGHEWETTWVAETIKQANLANTGAEFTHLRTTEGREVDLLLELDIGYIALEFKLAEHVVEGDARHLRDLSGILDKPLLAGLAQLPQAHTNEAQEQLNIRKIGNQQG